MWIKATQASVSANGTIITVNSGESFASVQPGDAAILGANSPVEILRTQQAAGGAWQLVLEEGWPYAAVTNGRLRVQPNGGRFEAAIQAMRDVNTYAVNSHAAMNAWLTSTAATISVEKADGSSVSIPTLHSYTSNWGTAALRNVGTAAGNVMQVGAFGVGDRGTLTDINTVSSTNLTNLGGGFSFSSVGIGAPDGEVNSPRGNVITLPGLSSDHYAKFWVSRAEKASYARVYVMSAFANVVRPFVELLSKGNTTVDSNGFIKAASPIIKLFADAIDTNAQAQEQQPQFTKNGMGDYTITGTSGLAKEGWWINTPKDSNGNTKVIIQTLEEIEQPDGTITINVKTTEPRYGIDETGRLVGIGAPCDIPAGRWIDIRLNELPVDDEQLTEAPEPESAE